MAELVDALDSKSGFRKGVQVRFLFWAHNRSIRPVFLCPEITDISYLQKVDCFCFLIMAQKIVLLCAMMEHFVDNYHTIPLESNGK